MSSGTFHLFGSDHLIAIGTIAFSTGALIWLARRHPRFRNPIRWTLSVVLLILTVIAIVLLRRGGVPWTGFVPLQLCDLAVFVAIFALLTLRPLACELIYFWGATGTLLAVLTPDLDAGFPSVQFLSYFTLHGTVIAAALLVPFGLSRPPRKHAQWRVLLTTHLYAAGLAIIDFTTGANFLYLRAKPTVPTLLDRMGPWPVYLIVADVIAVILFNALALPFTRRPRFAPLKS